MNWFFFRLLPVATSVVLACGFTFDRPGGGTLNDRFRLETFMVLNSGETLMGQVVVRDFIRNDVNLIETITLKREGQASRIFRPFNVKSFRYNNPVETNPYIDLERLPIINTDAATSAFLYEKSTGKKKFRYYASLRFNRELITEVVPGDKGPVARTDFVDITERGILSLFVRTGDGPCEALTRDTYMDVLERHTADMGELFQSGLNIRHTPFTIPALLKLLSNIESAYAKLPQGSNLPVSLDKANKPE